MLGHRMCIHLTLTDTVKLVSKSFYLQCNRVLVFFASSTTLAVISVLNFSHFCVVLACICLITIEVEYVSGHLDLYSCEVLIQVFWIFLYRDICLFSAVPLVPPAPRNSLYILDLRTLLQMCWEHFYLLHGFPFHFLHIIWSIEKSNFSTFTF